MDHRVLVVDDQLGHWVEDAPADRTGSVRALGRAEPWRGRVIRCWMSLRRVTVFPVPVPGRGDRGRRAMRWPACRQALAVQGERAGATVAARQDGTVPEHPPGEDADPGPRHPPQPPSRRKPGGRDDRHDRGHPDQDGEPDGTSAHQPRRACRFRLPTPMSLSRPEARPCTSPTKNPRTRKATLVGPGDLAAQAGQVFANLGRALAAAGARPGQVARITIYVVHHPPEFLPVIENARTRLYLAPGQEGGDRQITPRQGRGAAVPAGQGRAEQDLGTAERLREERREAYFAVLRLASVNAYREKYERRGDTAKLQEISELWPRSERRRMVIEAVAATAAPWWPAPRRAARLGLPRLGQRGLSRGARPGGSCPRSSGRGGRWR